MENIKSGIKMPYSPEIKRKANSLANLLSNDTAKMLASIDVEYTTADNLVIFNNLLSDFLEERNMKEQFEKWLRQKSIIQAELF